MKKRDLMKAWEHLPEDTEIELVDDDGNSIPIESAMYFERDKTLWLLIDEGPQDPDDEAFALELEAEQCCPTTPLWEYGPETAIPA